MCGCGPDVEPVPVSSILENRLAKELLQYGYLYDSINVFVRRKTVRSVQEKVEFRSMVTHSKSALNAATTFTFPGPGYSPILTFMDRLTRRRSSLNVETVTG